MSDISGAHHQRRRQRRVRNTLIVIVVIFVIVAVPLAINDQLRLDVAYKVGMAPGGSIERVAQGDGVESLIVIPFKAKEDTAANSLYRSRAQYLATAGADSTTLFNIVTGKTVTIPLTSLDYIAASNDGSKVFIRQGDAPSAYASVLLDTRTDKVDSLPAGASAPTIAGDWTTPIWSKTNGRCGPRSVTGKYIACFPRSHLAQYLAGDWQLNIQVYGDYRQHEDLFRGLGFLPTVGWNDDDSEVWFANEKGIWRAKIDPSKFSI
ncbi:MAG TPA: hypothetical protein VFQ54_02060 [Thermomicrobiales bacterium]|nr:hypothetical protein [Thermomicrobiales bacterium]